MAIIKKGKQPKLSPEMEALINNSHSDGNGESSKYDIIDRCKIIIMDFLTKNEDILYTLHNKEIENKYIGKSLNGDDYRNESIFSFLKIPDIQSTVKNFVCFEVDNSQEAKYYRNAARDEHFSIIHITFRTISHDDDYITDYGVDRQDLLAEIIKSEFDWTNKFGNHATVIYDKGRIAENGYYYREFVYEFVATNNLINKSQNGGVSFGR